MGSEIRKSPFKDIKDGSESEQQFTEDGYEEGEEEEQFSEDGYDEEGEEEAQLTNDGEVDKGGEVGEGSSDTKDEDYAVPCGEQDWEARCLECKLCKLQGYTQSDKTCDAMCNEHKYSCLKHIEKLRSYAKLNVARDDALRKRFRKIRKQRGQKQSSGSFSAISPQVS